MSISRRRIVTGTCVGAACLSIEKSGLALDTRMKKGWVTGEELTVYLERELELVFSRDAQKLSGGWGPRTSGMEMSFNAQALPGKRLTSVKVNGEEVEKNRKYTIAGREREGDDSSSNGRISLEAEDNQTNPGTAVTRNRFSRCRVQSGPTAGFFQSLVLLPLSFMTELRLFRGLKKVIHDHLHQVIIDYRTIPKVI